MSNCPFPSQGIFLTQGLNLGLKCCRQILYHLSYQGIPSQIIQTFLNSLGSGHEMSPL